MTIIGKGKWRINNNCDGTLHYNQFLKLVIYYRFRMMNVQMNVFHMKIFIILCKVICTYTHPIGIEMDTYHDR